MPRAGNRSVYGRGESFSFEGESCFAPLRMVDYLVIDDEGTVTLPEPPVCSEKSSRLRQAVYAVEPDGSLEIPGTGCQAELRFVTLRIECNRDSSELDRIGLESPGFTGYLERHAGQWFHLFPFRLGDPIYDRFETFETFGIIG